MGGIFALSPSTTELTVRDADMRGRGRKQVTSNKLVEILLISHRPNQRFLYYMK